MPRRGAYWWGPGTRFAYVKATESLSYRNPYFAQQSIGSYDRRQALAYD